MNHLGSAGPALIDLTVQKSSSDAALLELYKLHVQMTDNISARRQVMNNIYMVSISAVFAAYSFSFGVQASDSLKFIMKAVFSGFGFALSVLWVFSIFGYRRYIGVKFNIIQDLEKSLPVRIFTRESYIMRFSVSPFIRYFTNVEIVHAGIAVVVSIFGFIFAGLK